MSHTSEDMIIDIADQWSYNNKSYTELKHQLEELVLLSGIENENEIIHRIIDKACEWLSENITDYEIHDGKIYSKHIVENFRKAMEEV